jgi:hypothetical protein
MNMFRFVGIIGHGGRSVKLDFTLVREPSGDLVVIITVYLV